MNISKKLLGVILLAVCNPLRSANEHGIAYPNLIERISVQGNKITVTPHEGFKKQYLTANFFAEYDADINLKQFDATVLAMPFIMNVISIVWISGNIYSIDEMDEEIFHSLERVKKVFQTMYPNTNWYGELKPRKLVSSHDRPNHYEQSESQNNRNERTALLFSGGLDSTSTALAHLDKKLLLITAWGHWDLPLTEPALWNIRKKKITAFAHQFENEASFIRSNYQSFLKWEYLSSLTPEIKKWRLGAVEGLGWAGLCAPILLSKGYPTLRIASSHTWLYPFPSAASPFVDNNIRLCGLQIMHDQFDMTRLQKIAFVCDGYKKYDVKQPFLKICSVEKKFDSNCCNCRKCISTAVGFYALNKNPKEYGLNLSLTQAVQKTEELLAPSKLNFYTILYFKELQHTLKLRVEQGEKLPAELSKLLAINLEAKIPYDTLDQWKIDWGEMKALLPNYCPQPEKQVSNHFLEL